MSTGLPSSPAGTGPCLAERSSSSSKCSLVPAAMYRREVSVCVDGHQRTQPACLRSAAASCSCLRQRGTQMHGSVRGCRLVRAPSLRITGTRGQAHLLVSRCLLLLAVLLATESQLVGFGAAIGRRYDAAARHQCGLLHAAPHGLLASRIGLGHGSRLWPKSGANGFAPEGVKSGQISAQGPLF